MIKRIFHDTFKEDINENHPSYLVGLDRGPGVTWNDLLSSKRVLIVSEAGTGKTYECRAQAERLRIEGDSAFFVELAALSSEDLSSLLDIEEEIRLNAWLDSQSEIATFFLDSIDELKLTRGSFERSLLRFKRNIKNQLHRARIVITTRPIPYDEQLVRRILPVPQAPISGAGGAEFAKLAMREHLEKVGEEGKIKQPDWRTVVLMPLSDAQIIQFSEGQGVSDPDLLFKDIQRRNAQEFASRPQDLIELCADWREHKRIRTHAEQIFTSIRVKLLPRDNRVEPAELSADKAIEGASRLALAIQMTRHLTIRYGIESDAIGGEATLDPALILSDWKPSELKALLERPLFGFASYGRVRFHHRSVSEYLAAERLWNLYKAGMSFRALKRVLFTESKGRLIVLPSKRPIAGWLALREKKIFEILRDNEPEVLLHEGDPESLTQLQRNQILNAYCSCYGSGGWRGFRIPQIQVHRFASKQLAEEIQRIWSGGVKSSDIREALISLIEEGGIKACADIAYDLACSDDAREVERIMALDALIAVDDYRLKEISANLTDANGSWSDRLAHGAMLRLFPKYMSVEQLGKVLGWIKWERRSLDTVDWQLQNLISTLNVDLYVLEELRDYFSSFILEGLAWQKEWPHITSDRVYFCGGLAAICDRGLVLNQDDSWLRAAALALRLQDRAYTYSEAVDSLRERLNNLKAERRMRLFLNENSFLQSLRKLNDPWKQLIEIIVHDGPIQLRSERDLGWIKEGLANDELGLEVRAVLLEAGIYLSAPLGEKREFIENLKGLIADESPLLYRIDEYLKPSKWEEKIRSWEEKQAKRNRLEEDRRISVREFWIQFWEQIINQPEEAFSSGRSRETSLRLWEVMRHINDNDVQSGWNRNFIEKQFNSETANRFRCALMEIWRAHSPILPSERLNGTHMFGLCQLGLLGVYAEAEDPEWAVRLTDAEVRLAARYAPVELNRFPQWIDVLAGARPNAVDQTLGCELSWELDQRPSTQSYMSILPGVLHSSGSIGKLFLPRLESWMQLQGDLVDANDNVLSSLEKVRQVANAIMKHGDDAVILKLQEWSCQRLDVELPAPLQLFWLSILIRINPAAGIEKLAIHIEKVEPAELSEAVVALAGLFGDRHDAINLSDERFSPQLLLQLLRLAYRHIRIQDDPFYDGACLSGLRDNAQCARNNIVTGLLSTTGEPGWAAKLEMANDPLCAHFKDRIMAVAKESWAQEIDVQVFTALQAVTLDRSCEAPASTNGAMFAIMKDRLFDLEDLLLSDTSPREAWAGITLEKAMRRVIANELRHMANSIYTVDQEAVTADEKETDIRLRSTISLHEAVIELKLGDARTAKDLCDTIGNQLVKKYMAAEHSKAGALLVTIAKDRTWEHPLEKRKINAEELLSLLLEEAERVQRSLKAETLISVHLLDLRARLPVE